MDVWFALDRCRQGRRVACSPLSNSPSDQIDLRLFPLLETNPTTNPIVETPKNIFHACLLSYWDHVTGLSPTCFDLMNLTRTASQLSVSRTTFSWKPLHPRNRPPAVFVRTSIQVHDFTPCFHEFIFFLGLLACPNFINEFNFLLSLRWI